MMASMVDEVKKSLQSYGGKWTEKKGLWSYSALIAERKAFLSKKKLEYSFRLRVDDSAKTVRFSEMLTEVSSGLSTGGGFDDDLTPGIGVKKESYNTLSGSRRGTIEEQSDLFGKDYSYNFNYAEIRQKVKQAAEAAGYQFDYQVLPVK